MGSSVELSRHHQYLLKMLDQAAEQLGMDRSALQRAKQQVAMIPQERVMQALQKVAVRTQAKPLPPTLAPSRPPEMARDDRKMMAEYAKAQDQRTLFHKDTKTPGPKSRRKSTLPPAQEVREEGGSIGRARALPPEKPRPSWKMQPKLGGPPAEIDEQLLGRLIAMKKELRAKGASQVQMAIINNKIAKVVGAGFSPVVRPREAAEDPSMPRNPSGAETAEIRRKNALDMEHGIHEGQYTEPVEGNRYGRKMGPDERAALTLKKDNNWARAREETENMEARHITVDKAFEDLQGVREGDKEDAARGLEKFDRRPVDQKDKVRGEWQTALRAESDNNGVKGTDEDKRKRFVGTVKKVMAPAVRENEEAQDALERAKREYGYGHPAREAAFQRANLARKRMGLLATDVIEESTRMPGEEAFAAKIMKDHEPLRRAYIERLEYLARKNPNDATTRDQLKFAMEGKYGAALSSGKMAYSKKLGNKQLHDQAERQRDGSADHGYRFTTTAMKEGRGEVERGEEKWSESEAVEKSKQMDSRASTKEAEGAGKYNRELDQLNRDAENKGSLTSRLGDEERVDRALRARDQAKLARRRPSVDKPPPLIRAAEKKGTRMTRKMVEQMKGISAAKLEAAVREEPMLFRAVKILLKKGH